MMVADGYAHHDVVYDDVKRTQTETRISTREKKDIIIKILDVL
jgi:hypothetical protein